MLSFFENLPNINDNNFNNIFSKFIQIIKNSINVHTNQTYIKVVMTKSKP